MSAFCRSHAEERLAQHTVTVVDKIRIVQEIVVAIVHHEAANEVLAEQLPKV